MSDVISVSVDNSSAIPVVNLFMAGPGQGLSEAPLTGIIYGRRGGAWVPASEAVTFESVGVLGDGSDETDLIQSVLDSLPVGGAVRAKAGAVYGVRNLRLPHLNSEGFGIFCDGIATFKAVPGGDDRYLAGSQSFVNDNPWGNWPVFLEGIQFDGSGIKDFGLALCASSSRITRCSFINTKVHAIYLTKVTLNGTPITNGVPDIHISGCRIAGNTGDGVFADNLFVDYHLLHNIIYNNSGFGMNLRSMGGVFVRGNHCYTNGLGPARFEGYGYATSVIDNIFDGDDTLGVTIQTVDGTTRTATFGPMNKMKCPLYANLGLAGTTPVVLNVVDTYLQGPESRIVHMFNGASRTIVVQGGMSEAENPLTWSAGNVEGRIIAVDHYSVFHGGLIDGKLCPSSGSALSVATANKIEDWFRPTSGGTQTDILLLLTVPNLNLAGSILEIDVGVHMSHAAGVNTDIYRAKIFAGFTKVIDLNRTAFFAEVVHASQSAGNVISIAPVWEVGSEVGEQTPVLRLQVSHPVASSPAARAINVRVDAQHRHTTRMVFGS